MSIRCHLLRQMAIPSTLQFYSTISFFFFCDNKSITIKKSKERNHHYRYFCLLYVYLHPHPHHHHFFPLLRLDCPSFSFQAISRYPFVFLPLCPFLRIFMSTYVLGQYYCTKKRERVREEGRNFRIIQHDILPKNDKI